MLKTFSATKNFKYCAILSVLLVAAGLVALLAAPFGVNLFNLDIDFAGGTSFTYQLGEEVTPDVLRRIGTSGKESGSGSPGAAFSKERGPL